jgi:hypothetical protein
MSGKMHAHTRILQKYTCGRCFFAIAAASVAALCVVQVLHDVFNLSSCSCRSRQCAVDESIKRADRHAHFE